MKGKAFQWCWMLVLNFNLLLTLTGWRVASPGGVQATGVPVTNCSDDTDFSSKLAGGGMVAFDCGNATIVLSSTKTISADTTIDGGGMIALSGGGVRRLFVVNAGVTFTLTNITLRDASSPGDDGGAISSSGTLNITNSRFFSNTAGSAWSGGAIRSFGPLTIRGSEFAYNGAGNGGALNPRETTGVTTISGSSFHDNYTTNTTNGWGGTMLVWNGAPVTIDSTSFVGNMAQQGGAIYLTSVSVLTMTNSSMATNRATVALGGAIYNNGTATVNNTTLSGNSASNGGGIANSGAATLDTSALSLNSASSGGGIWNNAGATLVLNNTTFSHNSASQFGGGISNIGTATLKNLVMSGNTVTQTGGALYNVGTATLNNTLLRGNSASVGGALAANIGTTTLNNSTLANNLASNSGGGIYSFGNVYVNASTLMANWAGNGGGGFYNDHSIVVVTNSTLSGNSTATLGGGFYNSGSATFYNATLAGDSASSGGELYIFGSAPTVLTNTIMAYSPSGGNCAGSGIVASKFTLSSDLTCGLPAGNTIKGHNPNGLDPLLTALGNYSGPTPVQMLKLGSPAMDGVVGSDAPAIDQRGFPRPQGGGYDIGAVERQPADSDLAPRVYLPVSLR